MTLLIILLLTLASCEAVSGSIGLQKGLPIASMLETIEEEEAAITTQPGAVGGVDEPDYSKKQAVIDWWMCCRACDACAQNADKVVKNTAQQQAEGHSFVAAAALDKAGLCTTAWKALTSCCVTTAKEVKDIVEEEEKVVMHVEVMDETEH